MGFVVYTNQTALSIAASLEQAMDLAALQVVGGSPVLIKDFSSTGPPRVWTYDYHLGDWVEQPSVLQLVPDVDDFRH